MYKILNFTSDANQKQKIVLSDGSSFDLSISFYSMQYGWFITELKYGDTTISGMRISIGANILHQFRNKLPFGLACFSKNNVEPMLIDDFSSGKVTMYVLSQEEAAEYAAYLSNG